MSRAKILWLFAAMLMSSAVGFAQQAFPDFDHPNGSFNNPNGGFSNSNVGFSNPNGGVNNSNAAVSPRTSPSNTSPSNTSAAAINAARQIESQLDQVWMNHDVNRLLSFFDQNTVWLTNGGRTTLAQEAPNFRQAFSSLRNVRSSTVVTSAAVQNGNLIINFTGQRTYDFFVQQHGWIPNRDSIVGQDIWTMKGGQWKLVQNRSSVSSLNGGVGGGGSSGIALGVQSYIAVQQRLNQQTTTMYQMKASDALNKH